MRGSLRSSLQAHPSLPLLSALRVVTRWPPPALLRIRTKIVKRAGLVMRQYSKPPPLTPQTLLQEIVEQRIKALGLDVDTIGVEMREAVEAQVRTGGVRLGP